MPSSRPRCINSGSIRGIGVHTSGSFCRRYYRRRSRCILPPPISLEQKKKVEITITLCNMSSVHFYPLTQHSGFCTNVSADIRMLYSVMISLCVTVTSAAHKQICPDQWERSLKSVSKQISAAADSLSLHILLSVKKREGSGRARRGELSGSDRAGGPLRQSRS